MSYWQTQPTPTIEKELARYKQELHKALHVSPVNSKAAAYYEKQVSELTAVLNARENYAAN